MANEISIPDGQRAAKLSLPPCATLRLKWLGTIEGRKYLSAGLEPLTFLEQSIITRQIEDLEIILLPGLEDNDKKMALITEMLIALAGGATDRMEVRVKNLAYSVALAGIPAWAVRQALDQWYRGEVRGVALADFRWPASPAALRRACEDNMEPYRTAMDALRDVLLAKPLEQTMQEIDRAAKAIDVSDARR